MRGRVLDGVGLIRTMRFHSRGAWNFPLESPEIYFGLEPLWAEAVMIAQVLAACTQKPGGATPHPLPWPKYFQLSKSLRRSSGNDPGRSRRLSRRRSPSIRGIPRLSRRLTSMLPRGLWTNDCDVHTLIARERAVKPPAIGPVSLSGLRPRRTGGSKSCFRDLFSGYFSDVHPREWLRQTGNDPFPRPRRAFPKGNQIFPMMCMMRRTVRVSFPVPWMMSCPGNGPFPAVGEREVWGMQRSGSSPLVSLEGMGRVGGGMRSEGAEPGREGQGTAPGEQGMRRAESFLKSTGAIGFFDN